MLGLKSYFRPAGTKKEDNASGKHSSQTPSTVDSDGRNVTRSPTLQGTGQTSRPASSYRNSRPGSIYPMGDFRNEEADAIMELKSEMMVNHLWQQQRRKMWFGGLANEGVVLKKTKGQYACAPQSLQYDEGGLFEAIRDMNVRVAMSVNTRVVKVIMTEPGEDYIHLSDGLRLQIIPTVHDLPTCQKHHFAAFISDEKSLIVWDDDPNRIVQRAMKLEAQLVKKSWGENYEEKEKSANEKEAAAIVVSELDPEASAEDLEKAIQNDKRPTHLLNPFMVGMTLMLIITTIGLGWRILAMEIKIDPEYGIPRLGLLVLLPLQLFLSLFFMQTIIGNLMQVFGPTSQLKTNSKFYSAVAPPRLQRGIHNLPHMTIQCPVYKEGLVSVIQPTILSIKAAISTYELQGGTANIFINDDGMQLISPEDAQARKDFYDEHNIGWVSRPGHNPKPKDGEQPFHRRGKFKKASNMNYAFMISNKVEDKLLLVPRDANWNPEREKQAYEECLAQVLVEEEGRAWAEGNIRVGDYILLIDSDTRVPTDCLLDAASEMEHSPEVGVLQYSSGVMKVTDSFFESGVTFFTNLIYTAIRYTVSNGDVAPFVGHNAILRWSAIQQVSYTDEDGYEKFWSESHVSEDFDMSLRLQCLGYTIRLGAYAGEGYKEGVSLTVYDELNRWEKYAYGCNELLFHPLIRWPTRGPFTPLFRRFLFSNIRFTSKITTLAYIGTYYAIGAAWIMTLANFVIIGLLQGSALLSSYYVDSFTLYFSLIIVFSAFGNVALAILRYRTGEMGFMRGLVVNFKWLLLLSIFLGGLSLHVSQALLCHMFGINMTWGATSKELDSTSTFAKEWKKLLVEFRGTFVFCFFSVAIMVVAAHFVPPLWRFNDFNAVFPLSVVVASHFLLPVVLNPGLMLLKW
ncbi:MAG: hypothetical protein M1837_003884 [Sclerophora amabilis]|nr:MAG: hypothetical protein M1837_003884 [Sclerophora amabilis]